MARSTYPSTSTRPVSAVVVELGDLRRRLAGRGVSVSTPDAHVAQCALEREALLLTRDSVFLRIAQTSELRVQPG